MKVGPDRPAEPAPFETGLSVVPEAEQHRTERRRAGVEECASDVVLEPGELVLLTWLELAFEKDVTDHARRPGHGLVREQSNSGHQRAIASAVAATEELVPAAHRKHRHARRMRGVDRLALLDEVRSNERLLAILAATDVEEVVRMRVNRVSEVNRANVEVMTAKGGTPDENRHVPAIGIDVQVVGVEMADDDPHGRSPSQYGRTSPRAERIFRSASIAV